MGLSKELRVGIVSVAGIALLIWGLNFLKGTNLFFKNTTVYAIYPSVGGLAKSSPILINGFEVGVVQSIYFHPDQSGNVVVELMLTENNLKIPKNSVAKLVSLDFLGSKAIGLKLGDSPEQVSSGDTLQTELEKMMLDEVSDQILPIKEKAERLMTSMDTAMMSVDDVLANLNEVFSHRNKHNLTQLLINVNTTLLAYQQTAIKMNASIDKMNPILKNFKQISDSLAVMEMNKTIAKTQQALDEMATMLNKINEGEGTLGQLANNDSLYIYLEAVSKDLDKLLVDFKAHPKRYVHFSLFGRKEKD